MEAMGALLVILFLMGLAVCGPLAIILITVLFNKLGGLSRRLDRLEGKASPEQFRPTAQMPPKEPAWSGRAAAFEPVSKAPAVPAPAATPPAPLQEKTAEEKPRYAEIKTPSQVSVPQSPAAAARAEMPKPVAQPVQPPASARQFVPVPGVYKPKPTGGLELKIGTTFLLIAGIIVIIFAAGWFLKSLYEKGYFGPVARVTLVAIGGAVGVILGEILRRCKFEIVAKGISALGFALLYAAVFGGSRVYHLFSTDIAFALSILITALAMAYAVVLNEIVIAFLSLLGGYLAPVIISTGQNLPIPLFSYVLTLSLGAMACAMFRRWRAVNWIAMAGTWLLYTAWFEKFYTPDQMAVALWWLSIFACLYLALPILYGLVRRIEARAEDVVLVVVNSITVFYYLYQILHAYDQKKLALAAALLGAAHLVMMAIILWRCRADIKLQASLGVVGIGFITAALPMYFEFQAALVGWSIEAVALTFIGIRYRSLWTQVMAILVAAISVIGLLYNLPLHADEDFRVFLNSALGTWLFVAAGILVCHLLWRFMKQPDAVQASFASQIFYVAGVLLCAIGLSLEWHAHCCRHMTYDPVGESLFLQGMMLLCILLVAALFVRPLCPRGQIVRTGGIVALVFGAAFIAIAMMGVYAERFRLFLNIPFGLALGYLAAVGAAAWQFKKMSDKRSARDLPAAIVLLGVLYLFVILTEQMYLYWSCLHDYGGFEGDWKSRAFQYIFITWALYGLVVLAAGLRWNRAYLLQSAFVVSGLSAIGLFFRLPLHTSDAFQLAYNAPFITWVIVAVCILIGHGLWRFKSCDKQTDAQWIAQFYYAGGILLLAVGAGLEWAEHCQWHLHPGELALSHLHRGLIMLCALTIFVLLARPLSPGGTLVNAVGLLTAFTSAVYSAFAMTEVYYAPFRLFFNWPFAIAAVFVISMLLAAWFVRGTAAPHKNSLISAALVVSTLLLVWILLSQQVYFFWYCKGVLGSVKIANWSFSAQMYMSVTWAVYAAVLMIIGFAARRAFVRWLSLFIFAVLLCKIFIVDTSSLRTEYRIAAFVTTGLILVGVSFLYQLLKNRGFFDSLQIDKIPKADQQ
ncbi:MAG: DUF2339 domain-containing protein [Planctomycetaceae bacterium]|nr:DUF2339 domain-containing protein [Planctomycetaceae bacterium]